MKIRQILTGALLVVGMVGSFVPCNMALAADDECAGDPRLCHAGTDLREGEEGDTTLWDTISRIINVLMGVLGIVSVIVTIIGGLQYTVSAGEPAKAKKAKDTIIYGIIGLAIALLSFAIVNFVLTSVFG